MNINITSMLTSQADPQLLPLSAHDSPASPQEEPSLIYELMLKREHDHHQALAHQHPQKPADEPLPSDTSDYGELLEVNELFVKDEQLNREVIRNYHQHVEEDNRIKVFIDPSPKAPPRHTQPPLPANPEPAHHPTPQQLPTHAEQQEEEYETVKEEERQRPIKERRSSSKDLRIRDLVKVKLSRNQEAPKTTRKKTAPKDTEQSSRRKPTSSEQEMDSYEQFKEYKRKKDARGVKNLIKKVDDLERQVQVLKGEKQALERVRERQELEKMQIIAREQPRKQYGITSNLISIKVESDHLREDILNELKKIKQKVDHLDGRRTEEHRGTFDQYASLSPAHMAESKMEHTNLILSQARDRSKTGKIFKKSDAKSPSQQEQPQAISNEMLQRQDPIENISEIAERPRHAIAITKQAQQHHSELRQHLHEGENTAQREEDLPSGMKTNSNLEEISKHEAVIPPANSQIPPAESVEAKPSKNLQESRDRRKMLEHKQPAPPHEQHQEARGFIRSGLKLNSFPLEGQHREEEDLRMLEFDTGKEKFIVDSRNTEEDMRSKEGREGRGKPNSFEEACALLPEVPTISRFPSYDSGEQELVEMGKELLRMFGVAKIEDDQTVLKVKKYKNCTYFGIDAESNVLLHYEGRVYFGGWREFMNGEGEKTGEGVEYQQAKFIYKGHFRDGKRNGSGVLKVYNSAQKASIFVGQFYDGLKHGEGRQFDENGVSYSGEWKEGKKDGFGKLMLGHGEYYEGTFEKGMKSGHGVEVFKNGDKYQGSYAAGKFEGRGRYYWSNGSIYEGEFRNGMRNGKGQWSSAGTQGDTYDGEYQDDLKHGFGVYRWANGSSYEGNFHRDQKHGKGVLTHENGKVSKLEWENGNVVGKTEQSHSQSQSALSNTNVRNHSRSLPVSKHVYAQKQSERLKPVPNPIINNEMLNHLKSSSASSLPKGVPNHHRQPEPIHRQPEDRRDTHRPEPFMKLYEMSERPMTSKSMSNVSNNFKLERKSKEGRSDGLPRDPPYKGIRPTTNMINF